MEYPQTMPSCRSRRPRRAFTIIELLTVIAIVGILAGILIPTVTGANNSAKRSKTKVQFSQWALAIDGFRQEYGYYPDFRWSGNWFGSSIGIINPGDETLRFVEALSGRRLNGETFDDDDPGMVAGNTKGIRFYQFSTNDLQGSGGALSLQDGFGNERIVCLVDTNHDGMIKIGGTNQDYANWPELENGLKPESTASPVRASVIFYSAGDGRQLVKSWE